MSDDHSKIKVQISSDIKDAMRAREKQRLGVLRLVMSEFKKVEVDERIELDDTRVLAILDKMSKQRKDSFTQFDAAGREDLANQEAFEIELLKQYMPEQLDEAAIAEIISAAIERSGASSMKDMGQLMGLIRPQLQGRADMGSVSAIVKHKLNS
ncbi:MAG: GatB/YqeY domain-containing protein [Pseudomonadales bacterium]|nr:GatB/YqeY domain-containing protein [Pseudomonadales bacterium]